MLCLLEVYRSLVYHQCLNLHINVTPHWRVQPVSSFYDSAQLTVTNQSITLHQDGLIKLISTDSTGILKVELFLAASGDHLPVSKDLILIGKAENKKIKMKKQVHPPVELP